MKTKSTITVYLLTLVFAAFGQKDNPAEITDISIDSMGDIRWTASYVEISEGATIVIERFKDNKWIEVGSTGYEIIPPSEHVPEKKKETDSRRVKFHKGTNRYRLRMVTPSAVTSPEIILISRVSNDDGSLWIAGTKILLEEKEEYEILDHYGVTIARGNAQTIDISTLPRGSYYFYTKKTTRPFVK